MQPFYPIHSARFVEDGTVADLKMTSGRVYRAIWMENGRITAWWPMDGRRKRPIGLYDPHAWRPVNKPVPCAEVITLPVVRIERF